MARVSAPRLITDARKGPAPTEQQGTPAEPPAAPPEPSSRGGRKAAQRPRGSAKTSTRGTTSKGRSAAAPQNAPEPAGGESPTAAAVAAGSARATTPRLAEAPEPDGIPGEKRISLPLWQPLWRELQLARVDDGVDTTVRIRAMIELWAHDPRLRGRIDKLAKQRAGGLHRGRPRKET